jgi:hypothetical protein
LGFDPYSVLIDNIASLRKALVCGCPFDRE